MPAEAKFNSLGSAFDSATTSARDFTSRSFLDDEDMVGGGETQDRVETVDQVVAEILVKRFAGRVIDVDLQDRIAVGLRFGGSCRADRGAGAGDILDDDRLAESLEDFGERMRADHIKAAARRIGAIQAMAGPDSPASTPCRPRRPTRNPSSPSSKILSWRRLRICFCGGAMSGHAPDQTGISPTWGTIMGRGPTRIGAVWVIARRVPGA